MPKNIIDKIWDEHVVVEKLGHPAVFGIDLQLIHEVTSPQAFQKLRDRGLDLKYPGKLLATLDHSIPTRPDRQNIYDEVAKKQVQTLRKNVKDFGVKMYDFESGHQGIVHVIGPELGLTQPGMTIVCGDSHTSTHGAFGALAFGVGTTEVGLVMATGCILQKKPKTMKVEFGGKMPKGVYSKDLILKLIADIGVGGANGYVIEFTGEAIHSLSMEARMSICNMSIECGARAGLISPDEKTFEFIKGRVYAPKPEDWTRAVEYWQGFASDEDAAYDAEVVIDINHLTPRLTWGINPAQGLGIEDEIPSEKTEMNLKALDYTKLNPGQKLLGEKLDWVFIGSCTNSRMEDLRVVASIFYPGYDSEKELDLNKVSKVALGLNVYIVPGSEEVKRQAEEEGLDKIFTTAGADWRMPGCSMCLGMNDDKVPSGMRCLSTSNRNFMHRQGPGAITHLCSPATAAYSALKGVISDVRDF